MLGLLPVALSALVLAATATPVRRANTICAADIIKIAPGTSSCDDAPAAGECRTADQAAPYVAISYVNFGIESFGEQAALLSLMLYESDGFNYSKNHFPGVPGQGTRNMQSPAFNLKYAEYLSTVCTNCGITPEQVQEADSEGPEAVLALVNTDQWSFGSAAWYLATQCDAGVRQGLAAGTQEGWAGYLGCIDTADNDQREALWSAALALKQW